MQLTEQQVASFKTFGYLVVRELLTPTEVETVTQAFDWSIQTWGGGDKQPMPVILLLRLLQVLDIVAGQYNSEEVKQIPAGTRLCGACARAFILKSGCRRRLQERARTRACARAVAARVCTRCA